MKSPEPTQGTGVEAVECALAILKTFSARGEHLSLAELARRTGLYKSRILRLASSLERMGFIVRKPSGEFALGPELPRLAALYDSGFDLERLIRPELLRLVAKTRETAAFYILDGAERICLWRENSPQTIRHHLEEGARLPLEVGAAGRVLMAFSRPQSNDGQAIRENGWYVSLGERNPDAAAVAVPLFDGDGALLGALSVSGLRSRFTDMAQRRILKELQASVTTLVREIAAAPA